MRKVALASLFTAHRVWAYGEGNAAVKLPTASSSVLSWGGAIEPCAVRWPGTVQVTINVELPEESYELKADSICVLLTARFDRAQSWWFVAPPPADEVREVCAPVTAARTFKGKSRL